jgi:phospholipid/cholesterol/gamma-HCH transport system substrate-binding protein
MTSGLLGEQYVGIEPGPSEVNLAAGDVVTNTQSAVVLENLIGQFLYGQAAKAGGEQ